MSTDNDNPPQKPRRSRGRYMPGECGNRRGRPKGSKNLKTLVQKHLAAKVTITENGKPRKLSKVEAMAIQLVNMAAMGNPKALAAIMNLTREYDGAAPDASMAVLARAEDAMVIQGIVARIREQPAKASPGDGGPAPDDDETDESDSD